MKPLERALKLIALSASSNEHEARTAAFEACRLIREHKMMLSAPNCVAPPPPPSKVSTKAKRAVINFANLVKEASARSTIERRRPDLKKLTHDYSGAATLKLAEIAEQLGLTQEAAVLREAAAG